MLYFLLSKPKTQDRALTKVYKHTNEKKRFTYGPLSLCFTLMCVGTCTGSKKHSKTKLKHGKKFKTHKVKLCGFFSCEKKIKSIVSLHHKESVCMFV